MPSLEGASRTLHVATTLVDHSPSCGALVEVGVRHVAGSIVAGLHGVLGFRLHVLYQLLNVSNGSFQVLVRSGALIVADVDEFLVNLVHVVGQQVGGVQVGVFTDDECLGLRAKLGQLLPQVAVSTYSFGSSLDGLHGSYGLGLGAHLDVVGSQVGILVLLRSEGFAVVGSVLLHLAEPELVSLGGSAVVGQVEVVEHHPVGVGHLLLLHHSDAHGVVAVECKEHLLLVIALLEIETACRRVVGCVVGDAVVGLVSLGGIDTP